MVAGFYRLDGVAVGHGQVVDGGELPGSFRLGRVGEVVQACEALIMAVVACEMAQCGRREACVRPAVYRRQGGGRRLASGWYGASAARQGCLAGYWEGGARAGERRGQEVVCGGEERDRKSVV